MAGDIKAKWGTVTSLTVTNLHSLAASSSRTAGWTSGAIDLKDTVADLQDILVNASFTSHASNRQAGNIDVRVYSALDATPTWGDLFSAGTEGTEGTATFHDTYRRNTGSKLLTSIIADATASAVYVMDNESVAMRYGGPGGLPTDIALFVGQNIATSTNAGLAAAGSTVRYIPVLQQYT
jgi:hypothetical protein